MEEKFSFLGQTLSCSWGKMRHSRKLAFGIDSLPIPDPLSLLGAGQWPSLPLCWLPVITKKTRSFQGWLSLKEKKALSGSCSRKNSQRTLWAIYLPTAKRRWAFSGQTKVEIRIHRTREGGRFVDKDKCYPTAEKVQIHFMGLI